MNSVVLVFFSTQNQVPQIILAMGQLIYQTEAFSVVIRTTVKNSQKLSQYREKLVQTFDFFFQFLAIKANEQAYNSSIMLNLSPENLVLSKLNAFFEFLALFWEQKHRKKSIIFLQKKYQKKVCNFSNFSFDFFVFLVSCLQKLLQ